MKRLITMVVCLTLVFNTFAFAGGAGKTAASAIGSNKAAYIGGSTKEKDFPGAKKEIEGVLDTSDETSMKFKFGNAKEPRIFTIPYDRVIDMEYGQKAGRRVGAAIATAILISPIGLFLLFSKKQKHYLTIGYRDDNDKEQVAVFELGKGIFRTTLPILEARTGKKMDYQDDKARKTMKVEKAEKTEKAE